MNGETGDGGFTMPGLGDLLTQVQRKARVVNVIFNNGTLDHPLRVMPV
jgi:pyruvate dehydrogenase (quinone)